MSQPSEDRDHYEHNRAWTYYQFVSLSGVNPTIFYRRWRGVTDRIDRQTMTWVSVDPLYLSRYIENGEIGLDETTRARIETALGFTLPD